MPQSSGHVVFFSGLLMSFKGQVNHLLGSKIILLSKLRTLTFSLNTDALALCVCYLPDNLVNYRPLGGFIYICDKETS